MSHFRFVDLFAGIGGFHFACHQEGGQCVLACESDKFARRTYSAFHGDYIVFHEDATTLQSEDIPDFDMLCAGYPCQPFSMAGVSKRNSMGLHHGFEHETKGQLFFEVYRILKEKQPKAFLLENVKNITSHDKGKTWAVKQDLLTKAGYVFDYRLFDASDLLPQKRERVFVAGLRKDIAPDDWKERDFSDFWDRVTKELEEEKAKQARRYNAELADWPRLGHILRPLEEVENFTISDNLWSYLQSYREKHRSKGNGFGCSVVNEDTRSTRTLSARYHKDGSEALVCQGECKNPRKLSPMECLRLQGFPESTEYFAKGDENQPVSNTQLWKQCGNAIPVPIATAIIKVLAPLFRD